jgi:Asp-tRNA(Asn)/Glu-tRNA(Gln) amidotransferase A subunit family amidase
VILGKTVSTEFAYFAPGPTRNPHNPEHTPGGSSSGSAAAVAAGYCSLALGTQTIGSISRPAAFCGVVGYKPTFGRISVAGVIPLAPSLDHIGLFASSVLDTTTAASVLCHEWSPVGSERRPVLGIPEGPYLERASQTGLEHFRNVCSHLQSLGWDLRSVDLLRDFAEIEARHQAILAAEVARVHQQWFSRYSELYHPRTRELVERGQDISDARLATALEERARFREALEEDTARAGVDLWLSPSAPGPAPKGIASTGDPVMNLPWTQAGLPTLSLPAGEVDADLPMGLQIAGRWATDETLLSWSEQLEKALDQM